MAVRDGVGLFNLSHFTKIGVEGPGAAALLQKLSANNVVKEVGKIVYTAMLTPGGGIRADLTVTRTGANRFMVVTGAGSGPYDLAWIRQHAPVDGSVAVTDHTSSLAAVGLWGPKARQVLAQLTDEDVSNEAFPYFTAKSITIGTVPAFALRLSYAGELGWEIYCPTEHGLRLWDLLWQAGQPHGIIAAGGGAFNSLRLEKGYRLINADIDTEYNPYEAGLGWAVRLKKGEFIGREALVKAKEKGIERKLCCLTLDDPGAVVLGTEPIVSNGETLGYVTSADYGYSVGKFIAYGYLPGPYAEKGTKVEIVYFDQRHSATVSDDPLFDAGMSRLKV